MAMLLAAIEEELEPATPALVAMFDELAAICYEKAECSAAIGPMASLLALMLAWILERNAELVETMLRLA